MNIKYLASVFLLLTILSTLFVSNVRGAMPEPPPKPKKPGIQLKGWKNTFVSESSIYGGSLPEVAYGRGRYAIAFDDNRDGNNEIYVSLLNSRGRKKGDDIRITNDPGASWNPTISWNGRTFGIFWYDNPAPGRGIYYAAINSRGKLVVEPTRVNDASADGVHPSAVWNKRTREYGVVWWDSRIGGAYFARVNRKGKVIKETAVSTFFPTGYYRPLIATNGKEYGIVWGENVGCPSGKCPEMVFARVDKNGDKLGDDRILTSYGATRPTSIVWNGKQWAVLAGLGHYAHLLNITKEGELDGGPTDLGNMPMSNAHFVWAKKSYGISWISGNWVTPEHPDNTEIVFQEFDRDGNPLGNLIRITDNTTSAWNSSTPIWKHRRYAVVWVDNLYEPDQAIYFSSSR